MAEVTDLTFEQKRSFVNEKFQYWKGLFKDFQKVDTGGGDLTRIGATDESKSDIALKSDIDLTNRIANPPTVDSFLEDLAKAEAEAAKEDPIV